jgi:hypothetical protein
MGWDTVANGVLGATVQANAYSPWVEHRGNNQLQGQDAKWATTAWSMLYDSQGNNNRIAQLGYEEVYGNNGGGYGTTGNLRKFFVEVEGQNQADEIDVVNSDPRTGLPSSPALEMEYIYNTLYDGNGNISSELGGPGVSVNIGGKIVNAVDPYFQGTPLRTFAAGFTPNVAAVAGETHTLNDQMPCDSGNHARLSSSGLFYNGVNGWNWHPMDEGPSVTLKGSILGVHGSVYGYQQLGNNEMDVWDTACSGSSGTAAANPTAITGATNPVDLFIIDNYSRLDHKWYANAWQPWETLSKPNANTDSLLLGQPAVVPHYVIVDQYGSHDEYDDVLARGSDACLWHRWWSNDAGAWQPWSQFSGSCGHVAGDPVAAQGSGFTQFDVFYPDDAGYL